MPQANSNLTCDGIRQRLSEQLAGKVFATRGGLCAITIPVQTPDSGHITIYVQQSGDSFLVHDGGATESKLFGYNVDTSQGGAKVRRERLLEQFNVAAGAGANDGGGGEVRGSG